MKQLILASSSEGRLTMLKKIGIIPDRIIVPDINESHIKKETPKNLSRRLAKEKAFKVLDGEQDMTDSLILSGDTVCCRGRIILEKASNDYDVRRYLELTSNKMARIYSSFCLVDCKTKHFVLKTVETRIKMKKITKEEMDFYVTLGEGVGKAGGYTICGFAECFVEKIIGSYSNVIGLPLTQVNNALRSFGYHRHFKR
jgi:septum formation protein